MSDFEQYLILVTLTVAIGLPFLLFVSILLRAWAAKVVTGKWPHQSQESKDIFDSLP